jgi:hypothetical protein
MIDEATKERMRIRAHVVANMNYFRERHEAAAAEGDDLGALQYDLLARCLLGIMQRIDSGLTMQEMTALSAQAIAALFVPPRSCRDMDGDE